MEANAPGLQACSSVLLSQYRPASTSSGIKTSRRHQNIKHHNITITTLLHLALGEVVTRKANGNDAYSGADANSCSSSYGDAGALVLRACLLLTETVVRDVAAHALCETVESSLPETGACPVPQHTRNNTRNKRTVTPVTTTGSEAPVDSFRPLAASAWLILFLSASPDPSDFFTADKLPESLARTW